MSGRGIRWGVAAVARVAVLGVCFGVTTALRWLRLFPNNDPIMGVLLPCAKRGRAVAVAFPMVAMVLFDLLTGHVGVWTAVTAGTYGLIGLAASVAFAARRAHGRSVGVGTYVVSGAVGVLVFDFITGPILSSLVFRMSFAESLVGQIPFTLKHLTSVAVYTAVVSPALDWTMRQIDRAEREIARRVVASRSAA